MSSVQQSLCLRKLRFRTPESDAVPCQDRQHLVAVQRHRRTRRTSAAAAAAADYYKTKPVPICLAIIIWATTWLKDLEKVSADEPTQKTEVAYRYFLLEFGTRCLLY